jgi:hypothetical protein
LAISCASCGYFDAGRAAAEALLPGLAVLSSAYGASRAGDGRCRLLDRLLPPSAACAAHSARHPPGEIALSR